MTSGSDKTSGEAPPEAIPTGTQKNPLSILLLEDEALVRMTVADELRDNGYRVVEGSNAEEGRSIMLADEPIALVITDINLPGADGLQFAAWIRKEFPDLPVILTSGQHEYAFAARPIGHFLAKPFRMEALTSLVRRSLTPAA